MMALSQVINHLRLLLIEVDLLIWTSKHQTEHLKWEVSYVRNINWSSAHNSLAVI